MLAESQTRERLIWPKSSESVCYEHSWAVLHQGGFHHVNNHANAYVVGVFEGLSRRLKVCALYLWRGTELTMASHSGSSSRASVYQRGHAFAY